MLAEPTGSWALLLRTASSPNLGLEQGMETRARRSTQSGGVASVWEPSGTALGFGLTVAVASLLELKEKKLLSRKTV